jgi:serine phosphatase RsbU (regulator of sigma subunit)
LFQPKDIVSGDFYWATKKENRFYLAVCDSTGHGVPGAFMSVLNATFLTEAINEKNISEPHQILNHVRKRLVESIGLDGAQDGMDCTLLCIDKSTNQITYSAAYHKPILMLNNKLIELEGDKIPVGKSDKMETFTLRTLPISLDNKRDSNGILYLFTDGYADQFGGPKGKKFSKKKFKELLLSIQHLPMNEQREALYNAHIQWRGNNEQVDDICVIGVRV